VKGQALLQLVDGVEVALLARFGEFVERRVGTLDVRGVVFAVVQFDYLCRVMGLERGDIVRKLGKCVRGHAVPPEGCIHASKRARGEKPG
jgi:hypothetical protein